MLTKIIQLAFHSQSLARVLPLFLFGVAIYAQAPLNKISVVHSFTGGADGTNPSGPLIQLSNGNFAGTTFGRGTGGAGLSTVFTMTPAGVITTLYTFPSDLSQGYSPNSLIEASDGNFYGVCGHGGADGEGTLFRITREGVFTKLYDFQLDADFFEPYSLLEAPDGYLYGLAGGGATGNGALFRYSLTTQQATLLYSFFSELVGPTQPIGGTSLGPDGRIYGNADAYYSSGGVFSPGAAYAIDLSGNLSTLAIYDSVINSAGNPPFFPNDGYAYFAGDGGGNNNSCQYGCGSIFRVAMDGTGAELIYSFTGGSDGQYPQSVTSGTDGLFYGYGSNYNEPENQTTTFFQVNATAGTGASFPFPPGVEAQDFLFAPVLQSTGGAFWGLTLTGGTDKKGIAFVLNVAAPKVPPSIYAFFPASGPPGTVVTVWGVNFALLSGVSLNGTTVQGDAKSPQFVRFVVPALAASGPITVTTAGGSAVSTKGFTVE